MQKNVLTVQHVDFQYFKSKKAVEHVRTCPFLLEHVFFVQHVLTKIEDLLKLNYIVNILIINILYINITFLLELLNMLNVFLHVFSLKMFFFFFKCFLSGFRHFPPGSIFIAKGVRGCYKKKATRF